MLSDINDIVAELSAGRMVVLVDDDDRENEGDLLMAARFADAEAINFMATHGRGLICLTLTAEHCKQLQLPMMHDNNQSGFGTNFTVSIESAAGVSTGISAHDRARTVQAAANPQASPDDIVMPGHVFPLRADAGGVLARAGHTEAGCDLARMAGLFPAAVICEIMNEDGSMARLPNLREFAKRHQLKMGAIKHIIEYRLLHERLILRQSETTAQTFLKAEGGEDFHLLSFTDTAAGHSHLAFTCGKLSPDRAALVRVLVAPTFLDGVLAAVPGRSWSVCESLRRIADFGCGALVLLNVDAADSGKIAAQLDAFNHPPVTGSAGRLRTYGIGAQILRDIGVGKMHLLSSRMTIPNLQAFGLHIEKTIEQ